RQLTERSPTNRLLPNVDAVVDAFSEAARIAQVVPILLEDDSIVLFVVVAVVEGCQDTQLLLALLTHAPSHAADDTSSVIQGRSREKWTHARVHRAANVDDVGGGERAAWVDVARHDPLVPWHVRRQTAGSVVDTQPIEPAARVVQTLPEGRLSVDPSLQGHLKQWLLRDGPCLNLHRPTGEVGGHVRRERLDDGE